MAFLLLLWGLPFLQKRDWEHLQLLLCHKIAVPIAVFKGKCNYVEIAIQTILAFVYGYLTTLSCWIIRDILVPNYPVQFLFMLAGCFILGLGIWIQFKGNVAMLPGEAVLIGNIIKLYNKLFVKLTEKSSEKPVEA